MSNDRYIVMSAETWDNGSAMISVPPQGDLMDAGGMADQLAKTKGKSQYVLKITLVQLHRVTIATTVDDLT